MIRPSILRYQYRFNSTIAASQLSHTTNESFLKALDSNPTLSKLWHAKHQIPDPDTINATTTLPIILRTKPAVFEDVKKANPESSGTGLKIKQYIGYAKSIIHFYKVGVQNVWRNKTLVNDIKKKYFVESVEKNGEIIKRRLKNGDDAVNILGALETMEVIEQETLQSLEKTTVLNLTRSELQTLLRTEEDFFKIPLFAIILLIFAETTPIVCYLFPEIAPSTCVFPGLLKKKFSSSINASAKLTKLRLERYSDYYKKGEIPFQSVHKLPHDELRLLVETQHLKSRYIPASLYPISILRSRLQQHYNKIKVDNYFLINGLEGNNVWSLNKSELIRTCLDRGLIDLSKDDLIHLGAHDLKLRLVFHLSYFNEDKSIGNVGVFGINNLGLDSVFFKNLGHDDAHKLYGLWGKEHKNEK